MRCILKAPLVHDRGFLNRMAGQFPQPPSSLGNFQCKITMPPNSVSTLCHLTPPSFVTILALIQLNVSHVAKKIVQKQKTASQKRFLKGKNTPPSMKFTCR